MAIKEIRDRLSVPNEVINRILYQEILEEMPLTLEEVPYAQGEVSNIRMRSGGEGRFYDLENNYGGKILHCPNPTSKKYYKHLLFEGISQTLAYRRGINVPRVEGIFKIKRREDGKFWPALVMQKLEGFKFENSFEASNVSDAVYDFSLELGKEEYKKALKLGVNHVDYAENMFACPKQNKTYLIDWSDAEIEGVDFSEIKMEDEE